MARSPRTRPRLTALCAVASLAVLATPPPSAAQTTWTGGVGSPFWSNPANWSDGIPETSDAVTWAARHR
jgi:hypothetical protein